MKEEDEREEERLPDEAMEANTTEGTALCLLVFGE